MNIHEFTAILSDHARERCAEMGISTKVAKQIVRYRSCTYRDHAGGDRWISTSTRHPKYAVVWAEDRGRPVIVTVLFNIPEDYERRGDTYRITEDLCDG